MSTDKQTVDWYNKNAKEYTAHAQDSVYHKYYEKPAMYTLIPDITGKNVLSLGCGMGVDSAHLKTIGAEKSVGIDISSELIKIATENNPECHFEVMDMEYLSFPDNNFGFAYSSLAIHYIENWTAVFKEVYRVLKPNSYFLFSCNSPVKYAMVGADTNTHYVLKLEISKNKETKEVEVIGDYLGRKKVVGSFGKDTVNTWCKSFSEISAEATSAGFLIEQIVEPKPTEELKNEFPEKYKKLLKIPEFVIFRLLKK